MYLGKPCHWAGTVLAWARRVATTISGDQPANDAGFIVELHIEDGSPDAIELVAERQQESGGYETIACGHRVEIPPGSAWRVRVEHRSAEPVIYDVTWHKSL